jgi:hypothetical protein
MKQTYLLILLLLISAYCHTLSLDSEDLFRALEDLERTTNRKQTKSNGVPLISISTGVVPPAPIVEKVETQKSMQKPFSEVAGQQLAKVKKVCGIVCMVGIVAAIILTISLFVFFAAISIAFLFWRKKAVCFIGSFNNLDCKTAVQV